MAGLPDELILRAEEILLGLEEEQGTEIHSSVSCKPIDNSSRFSVLNQKKEEEDIILEELKRIDIDSMTPLDALMKIAKWKQEL